MPHNKYTILFIFLLLPVNIFGLDIVRNNSFPYHINVHASSSEGGVFPNVINNNVIFTHSNIFSGLYKFHSIHYKSNEFIYNILYNKINNIPETSMMWEDNGNGIPELGEINYDKISYFDYKNISLLISKNLSKSFSCGIKLSNSNLYIHKSHGIGFNFLYKNKIYNKLHLGIALYDIISFNKWDTGRLEFNIPLLGINLSRKFNSLTIGFSILSNDIDLEYRLVGKLELSDNFEIYCGRTSLYDFTSGFIIRNNAIGFRYTYMMPSDTVPFGSSQQFSIIINSDVISKGIIQLRP